MLVKKHLPGEPLTNDSRGEALWLETHYWEQMSNAIANGINKAFK